LSFYFHGKAGAGKSSLVRHFAPALNAAIEQYADPEILVRYVKQNLNKPSHTLQLELELRPNNNDMSVMSIIQSRRLTMGQSKPGLVVVGLEEMASNQLGADPCQLATAQLIRQRFAGRKGNYKPAAAPRNSDNRGISGDATIVPLFTSNYELEEPSRDALQKLNMFRNLQCVEMTAVTGEDRSAFANQYLRQCIREQGAVILEATRSEETIQLDIPMGEGDTRPLVRHLRMLSFYVSNLLKDTEANEPINKKVTIGEKDGRCHVHVQGVPPMELRVGTMDNLFPVSPRVFDPRVGEAMTCLRAEFASDCGVNCDELSLILDFWLSRTLAPAVIVSTDRQKVDRIVGAVMDRMNDDVHCLRSVDASAYKMMRSLYDPSRTPNLRDDILRLGITSQKAVAIELLCETVNAQLAVREIIEDTPSMTAFSSEKSALQKDGLLFAVYVRGEITPEVRSRASLIL